MGAVNTVFVLPWTADSGISFFEDITAPVRRTGDRVEFWLPGAVPESLPPVWSPLPDTVICGGGADLRDIRYTGACLRWLEDLCGERSPDIILFPGTLAGHELGIRLGARLRRNCFPETRALIRDGDRLFARRKVCGSNLDHDAGIGEYPVIITVTGKKAIQNGGEGGAPRIETRPVVLSPPGWLLEYEHYGPSPDNPLETAPLIFAAGRGLGSKAACDRLRRAAGRFGAPLGFSRPAALNGWGEIDGIIGQSGVRTSAEVCIALGVSGAAAFMTGIESVRTLIAVNTDRNAPIFHYADIGIIGEAEEFIAALETETGNGE
jgi:electron transfer flavoprotein alpha subunit